MRTGLTVVFVAVLAAALSSYGWIQSRTALRTANASISTLERRAEASERLLVRRTEIAIAEQRKQQVINKEIQEVLKDEIAWSSVAVPAAVSTGLCKHLQCSPERSVQAP